jgi:hypothetical protein
VSYPQWKQVLAAAALPSVTGSGSSREIIAFLKHWKARHNLASVLLANRYIDEHE